MPEAKRVYSPSQVAARQKGLEAMWRAHRKYIHTEQTDAAIRAAYAQLKRHGKRSAISETAKKLRFPTDIVSRRAVVLGLCSPRKADKPWTEPENELLEQWSFLTPPRIALKFRKAGFQRTASAIANRRTKFKIRSEGDVWTPPQLAIAFGVDEHKVAAWIRRGFLSAAVSSGDRKFIKRYSVRNFMLNHPEEFDHARCEKYFLLDVLSKGKLCQQVLQEAA